MARLLEASTLLRAIPHTDHPVDILPCPTSECLAFLIGDIRKFDPGTYYVSWFGCISTPKGPQLLHTHEQVADEALARTLFDSGRTDLYSGMLGSQMAYNVEAFIREGLASSEEHYEWNKFDSDGYLLIN